MSLISAIVTVIFVHLGVTTFAQTDGSGPRCLSCNNIVNPATCRTVKECWNGESCFSEELLAENGTRIFNFGCKKNQECSRPKRFLSNGIVVHVCHHCCLQDLCNLNACFSTVDLACYSCRDKADPRDCFGIQLCADNEFVSTAAAGDVRGLSHLPVT
ncbi:prostate stem cell antigen-like [Liolophura sinensis]|uniref:prostate stem cell antigen-like n=1 Tax=Liolophura sinensis TaxID=3198878 RepID=UPI00315985FE